MAPTRPASLTVAVLPSGGNLNCTITVGAVSDMHARGFITFANGQATFRPATTAAIADTYVPRLHEWVSAVAVAPDGGSYIVLDDYDLDNGVVQVADASGTRTVYRAPRMPVWIGGWTREGILLLDGTATPQPGDGGLLLRLEMLDPSTGRVRPLPDPNYPQQLIAAQQSSGPQYFGGVEALWMMAYQPSGNLSVISRYDLATGATTVWYDGRIDGSGVARPVAETASGRVIIQVASTDVAHVAPGQRAGITEHTLLLAAPHAAQVLNQGTVGDRGVADNIGTSITDGSDVWMAADDGTLWRYESATGMSAVASIRTTADGAPGVKVSSPCIAN